MWSLPDIKRMNQEAADLAAQRTLEKQVENPQEHCCTVCDWAGESDAATYGYLVHDIFSDDAKDAIFTCERHDGYTGSPIEGYFTCADCDRVFVEHYTHEAYSVYVEDWGQVCLPCALKNYIAQPSNWIAPEEVQEVVLEPSRREQEDGNALFDPETGSLNLAAAQHLIVVKMPLPDSIRFVGNLEFDSCTGKMLSGLSSTFGPGVGERAALEFVKGLGEKGYSKFLVVLDAAYQFSVSIGFYVPGDDTGGAF